MSESTNPHADLIAKLDENPPKEITVHVCGVKCDHIWDGPVREYDSIFTASCSKCGASAFDVSMMEMGL